MKKKIILLGLLFSFAVSAGVIYYGPGRAVLLENILQFANFLEIEATDSDSLRVGGEVVADNFHGANTFRNHLPIGAFERGENDFNSYVDAAGVLPVDGTGGGPSTYVSCSQSATSPLDGVGSLSIVKFNTLSGGQGHGCSYDFNVGTDQAKVMEISFDYLWSDVAANVDGDFIVYIYDVDNGVLIQPVGYEIYRSALKSHHIATFQTDVVSDDYRVIFHVANDRAGVYSLKVDNLYIGPQRGGVSGAVVTDWEPTTITTDLTGGSGIIVTAFEKRVGDYAFYQGRVSWTTVFTGGSFKLNLPRTIETSKLATSVNYTPVGMATLTDSGSAGYVGRVLYSSSTEVEIRYTFPTNNYYQPVSTTAPFTWANADYVVFEFSVPILGWSSNTVMSEDAGNREIYTKIRASTDLTVSTASNTKALFDQVLSDKTASADIANSRIYAPESGLYDVTAKIDFKNHTAEGNVITVYKNGVTYLFDSVARVSSTATESFYVKDTVELSKNDFIEVFVDSATDTSYNIGGNSFLTIAKRSSPQTIAASEKVFASYHTGTLGQAVNNGDRIQFNTKLDDTHGAVTTGASWVFTAPMEGLYLINSMTNAQGVTAGTVTQFYTVRAAGVNSYETLSSIYGTLDYANQTTSSRQFLSLFSKTIKMKKGDTFYLIFVENLPAVNLSASPETNYITIQRIP